jgi:ribonuclease HI
LRARIAANARTFLVKIKAHRGEPLNERADDLANACLASMDPAQCY